MAPPPPKDEEKSDNSGSDELIVNAVVQKLERCEQLYETNIQSLIEELADVEKPLTEAKLQEEIIELQIMHKL